MYFSRFKKSVLILVYIEVDNVYNNTRQTRFVISGASGTACICIIDVDKNVKCSCESISQDWERVVDPGGWLTYPVLYFISKSDILISSLITAGPLVNVSNTSVAKLTTNSSVVFESHQPRFSIKRIDFAKYVQSNGERGDLAVSWDSRNVRFTHTPTADTVLYTMAYTIDIDGLAEVPVPFALITHTDKTTDNLYVRFAPKSIDSSLLNAVASVFCNGTKIDEFKPPIGVRALTECNSASVVISDSSVPIYVQYVYRGSVIHECETTTSCDLNQPPPSPSLPPPSLLPTGIILAFLSTISGAVVGTYIGKKLKRASV